MARNVKKVKVAKTEKNQKKFLAILISSIVGGAAVIAAIVVTVLMLTVFKKEKKYDYFKDIKDTYTASFYDLKDDYENDKYESYFIYYFDESLDPEDNKDDKQKEAKVIALANAIEEYNEKGGTDVHFYLINTSLTKNKKALTDSKFKTEDESSNKLVYMYTSSGVCDYFENMSEEQRKQEENKYAANDICGNSISELEQAYLLVKALTEKLA